MEGHFYILSDSVQLSHSNNFENKFESKLDIIKKNLSHRGSLFENRVKSIQDTLSIPKNLEGYLIVYLLDDMKIQEFIDFIIVGQKIKVNHIGTILHEDHLLNDHVFIDCNIMGCSLLSLSKKQDSLNQGLPVGDWLISVHAIPGSFVGIEFKDGYVKVGAVHEVNAKYATSFLIEWSRHRHKGWDDYIIKTDFDIQYIDTQNIVEC